MNILFNFIISTEFSSLTLLLKSNLSEDLENISKFDNFLKMEFEEIKIERTTTIRIYNYKTLDKGSSNILKKIPKNLWMHCYKFENGESNIFIKDIEANLILNQVIQDNFLIQKKYIYFSEVLGTFMVKELKNIENYSISTKKIDPIIIELLNECLPNIDINLLSNKDINELKEWDSFKAAYFHILFEKKINKTINMPEKDFLKYYASFLK